MDNNPQSNNDAVESDELSASDINDFLNDESDEEPLKLEDEKEEDTKDEDEDDKDKDEKEEDKEEDDKDEKKDDKKIKLSEEDEEEETEIAVPVSKKKILAKYPTLFKDFPYLEKAYYSDQQYKEILPTIDDAREAVEKSNSLAAFEEGLLKGSVQDVLAAVAQTDKKAFHKIVDNYMAALGNVDQGAFNHVAGNLMKITVHNMVSEAKRSNNEELTKAAAILHQFVFGTTEFKPPRPLTDPKDEERQQEINKERQSFVAERFNAARDDLDVAVANRLKSTINDNIDPKSSMTPYVKQNAIRDAMAKTDRIIGADKQFRAQLDKMWEQAARTNFSRESVQRIRAAFLSKARTVLPAVLQSVRNEALKGQGKSSQSTGAKSNRGLISPGGPKSSSPGKSNKASEVPKDMSSFDYLNSD